MGIIQKTTSGIKTGGNALIMVGSRLSIAGYTIDAVEEIKVTSKSKISKYTTPNRSDVVTAMTQAPKEVKLSGRIGKFVITNKSQVLERVQEKLATSLNILNNVTETVKGIKENFLSAKKNTFQMINSFTGQGLSIYDTYIQSRTSLENDLNSKVGYLEYLKSEGIIFSLQTLTELLPNMVLINIEYTYKSQATANVELEFIQKLPANVKKSLDNTPKPSFLKNLFKGGKRPPAKQAAVQKLSL